ncbi:type I restriction enzyme HsdR N-terminal domain-containing protein [Estrella lausannensis]|uniref:type I restriction enzyme HsdR N-terminal domain-containing protein n=1 Tax=Estrella lausannensis TaxID=483423 RepID=UPI00117B6D62|nr:type I restriction enzyme HsdR N-terminal domain-containing protein [Estrella lausannensis]
MASSKLKANPSFLHCQIRGKPSPATPEEVVRQSVVYEMIHRLSFPKSLIVLEKDLSNLVSGATPAALKRRFDVVAFFKDPLAGSLKPLLIVECKATHLDEKALAQLLGYNHFLKAPYFAAISKARSALFLRNGNQWAPISSGLLPYPVMIEHLSKIHPDRSLRQSL